MPEKITELQPDKPLSEKQLFKKDSLFFSLSRGVQKLVLKVALGEIDLKNFFEVLGKEPGKKAFYKIFRKGKVVKVRRSSGEIEDRGWIIDPGISESELNPESSIRVHNKQKHLEKWVPLKDWIAWNIE